jgi:hypothetical protein
LAGGFFQKQFSHRSNEFLHNEEYLKLKARTDVFARPVAAARLQAKRKKKRRREQQVELFADGAASTEVSVGVSRLKLLEQERNNVLVAMVTLQHATGAGAHTETNFSPPTRRIDHKALRT